MKSIFASLLLIVCFNLSAKAEGEGTTAPTTPPPSTTDSNGFEAHKAEVLSHITERSVDMDKFKSCVSAAKSKEEIKNCRKEHRTGMKEMHMKNREERMKNREEHRKEMQEHRNKMNGK